jgi:hypothetical protein
MINLDQNFGYVLQVADAAIPSAPSSSSGGLLAITGTSFVGPLFLGGILFSSLGTILLLVLRVRQTVQVRRPIGR